MIRMLVLTALCLGLLVFPAGAQEMEKDTIPTSAGNLEITFIGHGTLIFTFGGKVIHVDPWTQLADYTKLPKADFILVTHDHRDHFDLKAVEAVRTDRTIVAVNKSLADKVPGSIVLENGDAINLANILIRAVPAYNIISKRENGQPYHPKGEGNGYIIPFGDKQVYVAGDTENIPEMKELKGIEVAFLPMNLPFTMTPEMCAEAAKAIKPKILYPYHFGDTDLSKITELLKGSGIDVRLRKMK